MKWDKRAKRKVTIEVPTDEAFVYIAWGRDESRPLYVGKSRNLMARIGEHARSSQWYVYLDHFDIYGYRTELDAIEAEADAIHGLQPEYNVALNVGRPPRLNRYRRMRRQLQAFTYGERWPTLDDIPTEQRDIIARVQNRGKPAA